MIETVFEHTARGRTIKLVRTTSGFTLTDTRRGKTRKGFKPFIRTGRRRTVDELTADALQWAIDVVEGRTEL